MDLVVELVDLHCLVEAAGLVVPLQLTEEVALADFQRCVEAAESTVPNALWRRLDWLSPCSSQRRLHRLTSSAMWRRLNRLSPNAFVEEAGLAGPSMVVGLLLVEQN
jgi:hypothetical protein